MVKLNIFFTQHKNYLKLLQLKINSKHKINLSKLNQTYKNLHKITLSGISE